MFDFYRGTIEINFNRLPARAGSPVQGETGWGEEYFFPLTPGVDATRNNMRNLVAARAALLPLDCYIFRAGFGQASVCKSHYSLNGNAINPLITLAEGWAQSPEACNDIESGMLWRFENGAGRRWQRIITGLRDSWASDMNLLVGSFGYDPVSAMPAPQAATFGGVQATATATVSGGAVNSVSITAGGGPYVIPPPVFFIGGNNDGGATATLSGGVVNGVTGISGGSGYTVAPTVWIPPPQNEPWGLMPGQSSSDYIRNFLSCVANYCINFQSIRVPNSTFPSGYMTQGDTVPSGGTAGYVATRILFQRISDRDRGQIRTTNRGRKKVAI